MESDAATPADPARPAVAAEEPPVVAIKRFAMLDSFSSESDKDAAAATPAPAQRPRFGGGGAADLSDLLADSNDDTPQLLSPPSLTAAKAPAADVNGAGRAVVRRFPVVDSSGSAQDSPLPSPPRDHRKPAARASAAAAPSPAPAAVPTSQLVPVTQPAPVALAVSVSQPAPTSQSRTAVTPTVVVPSAAPAALRRATPERRRKAAKAAAPVVVGPPAPGTPPAKDGDDQSPSSGRDYTTVPLWTRHMKKRDGVYVTCLRVTNPTGLYDRSMKGLRRASERREALRAKLEEEAMADATFRPNISPRAEALRRRTGAGADDDDDAAAQLRHRLQLLELPDEVTAAVPHRHAPRLSHASELIVQACRERSGVELPPGERLYRDHFYRQQAVAEAAQPTNPQPAVVRSERAIAAHVAELYAFEQQRQRAIAAAREAPVTAASDAAQRVYVDPTAVVERLTRERPSSPHRAAAVQQERVQCPFQPQTSAAAGALAQQARLRSLHRWVRHFGGTDVLPTAALAAYVGPASHEAGTLHGVLRQRRPDATEWSLAALAEALAGEAATGGALAALWQCRPPGDGVAGACGDLTFRPRLNAHSASIVREMEAEQRCGPTHDRLFLSARSRQLTQRQRELEAEQAALEETQRQLQRRQRLQTSWRAAEAERLATHRARQAQERRESSGEAAPPPPPQPPVATPSRRLELQPSATPAHSSGDRAGARLGTAPCHSAAPAPAPASPSPVQLSASDSGNRGPSSCVSPPPRSAAPAAPAAPRAAPPLAGVAQKPPSAAAPTARLAGRELDRAAEALRELLTVSASRSTTHAGGSTAASHASSLPGASEPFAVRDGNRQPESSDVAGGGKARVRCLNVVLECARLRDPATVSSSERERLDRAQKRQLRELGRLLYQRNTYRAENS